MMVCLLFVKTSELDMIIVYLMCNTNDGLVIFLSFMHNYLTFFNNGLLELI